MDHGHRQLRGAGFLGMLESVELRPARATKSPPGFGAVVSDRFYVNPKSKTHDAASAHLRLYGLNLDLKQDADGTYFDVTPPDYWTKKRKEQFEAGLNELKPRLAVSYRTVVGHLRGGQRCPPAGPP
jgi:hypothetical protein